MMRKIYLFLFLFIAAATALQAQTAVSACLLDNNTDGIRIAFDETMNCAAAPGDLAGMTNIGFHSGANNWAAVIDWDAATALQATNDGSDVFTVDIEDPLGYYGVTSIDSLGFVFNQGPFDSSLPWDSEGKAEDAVGACTDFFIYDLAALSSCTSTGIQDLTFAANINIAPNPMGSSTVISFENSNASAYDIRILDLTGKVVYENMDLRDNQIRVERGNMSAGIYFLSIANEKGALSTAKLVVD